MKYILLILEIVVAHPVPGILCLVLLAAISSSPAVEAVAELLSKKEAMPHTGGKND
jgi:hypothetical protein